MASQREYVVARLPIAGVVLSGLALAIDARAACGDQARDLSKVFAATDAVFIGFAAGNADRSVDFLVNRAWKGIPDERASVEIDSATGARADLRVGANYLVWANRKHGRLRVAKCGRILDADTEAARADTRWLDSRLVGPLPNTDPRLAAYSVATSAFANRQFAEAARAYESISGDSDFRFHRECQVNLGIAYFKLQRFPEAIATLKKATDERLGNDGYWAAWQARRLRATAAWELALALIGGGEYERALQAIEDSAVKFPVQSGCGNGGAQDLYAHALYRGLSLEYLGRYASAIQSYLEASRVALFEDPTAAIRLVDLYESTGQLDELKAFAMRLGPDDPTTLRRVIELREMELAGAFDSLLTLLAQRRRSMGNPWESSVRQVEWEATQAATLLARHPDVSIPLLSHGLNDGGDLGFMYFALGLCATKEASEILEAEATKERASGYAMEVAHALLLAGAEGRDALDNLENSHAVAARYRTYPFPRHWFLEEGIQFPPVPTGIHLDAPVLP